MSIFDRTFHPDEANQAFTTGRLLETGTYRYDPRDHHGPTLYYAAAAVQKATGHATFASLDATLLRCTPLLFACLALLFGSLALRKVFRRTGGSPTIHDKAAGHQPSTIIQRLSPVLFPLLLGTSPIFAFFATDFIQEMLLVSFAMMMLWSGLGYMLSRPSFGSRQTDGIRPQTSRVKPGTWALLFGIAAGLAFATKETSILTFAAAGIAVLPFAWRNRSALHGNSRDAMLAFMGFALTATLLLSSFASDWHGVYNAFIAAPLSYLHRAAGSAASQGAAAHVHPWWQHLKWLVAGNGILMGYAATSLLLGCCALLSKAGRDATPAHAKAFFAFTTVYTAALTLLYSAIPYKTPWCTLQLHVPMLLSSLMGMAIFIIAACRARTRIMSVVIHVSFAVAICGPMLAGNVMALAKMFRSPDSKDIPYNYASASPQVKDLASLTIRALAEPKQETKNAEPATGEPKIGAQFPSIAAIALPAEDTWPLPFYLRAVGDKVGYWTSLGDLEALAKLGVRPDVVVVPAEEGHLVRSIFPHLTGTKRFEMRHRVRVRAFYPTKTSNTKSVTTP